MIGRTNAACNSGELHGAAISVTTEETTLIGKEVTLSKDSIVVDTKTVDDNGACSFTDIQDPGDYTVSASDGTDSTSETVTITSDNIVNKTVLSCVLSLIPDGSTVTPVDDVAVWLKCAGSKAGYTTTAEVLADNDTMFALTSDENAMKYLERSTSFANDLCADETFMTYLGQSPYVDDTILNSDLWVSAICDSSYMNMVFYDLVPAMTSDTTDVANSGAKVLTSGNFQNSIHYMGYKAFDKLTDADSFWNASGSVGHWLSYEFPQKAVVRCIGMYPRQPELNTQTSRDFTIQGSDDGNTWEDIKRCTHGEYEANKTIIFNLDNSKPYKIYRFYNNYQTYNYVSIGELYLYGRLQN